MPCYKPGRGIQAPNGALTYYGNLQIATGKVPKTIPSNYRQFALPCGKCIGCKLEYGRQWAVRLVHEKHQHKKSSFVTLTLRDQYLEATRTHVTRTHEGKIKTASLDPDELQLFTKRLNQQSRERFGEGIKYYACGEYGEKNDRPHYHIAIFGEDFSDDRYHWKHSKGSKLPLWRSSRLTSLWTDKKHGLIGDADIGELTFESAAYIARYITKKITGTKAEDHYKRQDERGEEYWLHPEFNRMSRRPGIGKQWFLQHKDDVYPHDHVISRGHPAKPPRYYDKLLEALAPYEHALIKEKREKAPHNEEDQTPARLEVRETVALATLNQKIRSLE